MPRAFGRTMGPARRTPKRPVRNVWYRETPRSLLLRDKQVETWKGNHSRVVNRTLGLFFIVCYVGQGPSCEVILENERLLSSLYRRACIWWLLEAEIPSVVSSHELHASASLHQVHLFWPLGIPRSCVRTSTALAPRSLLSNRYK